MYLCKKKFISFIFLLLLSPHLLLWALIADKLWLKITPLILVFLFCFCFHCVLVSRIGSTYKKLLVYDSIPDLLRGFKEMRRYYHLETFFLVMVFLSPACILVEILLYTKYSHLMKLFLQKDWLPSSKNFLEDALNW